METVAMPSNKHCHHNTLYAHHMGVGFGVEIEPNVLDIR